MERLPAASVPNADLKKTILNYFALTLVQRYFPVNFPAFFVFNWDFIYHLVQKWTRGHLRSAFILRTSADGLSK